MVYLQYVRRTIGVRFQTVSGAVRSNSEQHLSALMKIN
jgi:hypothetical protein